MACKHEGGTDPCVLYPSGHCVVQTKAYRDAHRDESKRYREANRDVINARRKAYREANREKIRAGSRRHYEANRDRVKERQKAYRQQPEKAIVQYKRNAQSRGYSWELEDEQARWLMQQPCAYCGQEIAGGIDRAKNEFGYTVLNSVPCCKTCNFTKARLTVKAFIVAVNANARYCPSYPAFKERWDNIRKKLTQLGEHQDAAVSVPMHRVSRSNRKASDICGIPETPVVYVRGPVGSDAGMSSVV
jgi:hypothetical protein